MGDQVLIRCLCGQFTETVQLQASIPVDNTLCHCNSCRHRTGALTFTGLRLASPPIEAFTTKLVKYVSSDRLWEYFCATCGTHVCYTMVKENRWSACSGAIDQVVGYKKGKLEKFVTHEYAGDTKDGGLLPLFPGPTVYLEDDGGQPVSDWKSEIARCGNYAGPSQPSKTLEGVCHCGNVKFSVGRPDER